MSDTTIVPALTSDFCRGGMQNALHKGSGYEILEFALSTDELFYKAPHLKPNLIIIDTDLPGMDAVESWIRLQELCPASGIIGRSKDDVIYDTRQLMMVGVRGMLEKDSCIGEIRHCLKQVNEGNFYYCPACCHLAGSKFVNEVELNETQRQVAQKLYEGKDTLQIAHELILGTDTVRRARGVINTLAGSSNGFVIGKWAEWMGYVSRKLKAKMKKPLAA